MTAVYLNHNNHALLVFKTGTKYAYAVSLVHALVRVIRVPKRDLTTMRLAQYDGAAYPLKRAVRSFKAIGKRLEITKSAKRALCSAAN